MSSTDMFLSFIFEGQCADFALANSRLRLGRTVVFRGKRE